MPTEEVAGKGALSSGHQGTSLSLCHSGVFNMLLLVNGGLLCFLLQIGKSTAKCFRGNAKEMSLFFFVFCVCLFFLPFV